ncbi:hypothetical protein BS78_10G094400 [Paspalum vaginatum]|nr:hypothetical protein BS78_10G094400 [Paspalum vaginatum]
MSSPLLSGPAKALTLPAAAASTCLLRRRTSHLLVAAVASTRTTKPLVSAAASSGLACGYHCSVAAAPSPRVSSSISQRRAGGGLVALTIAASAVAVSAFLISFLVIRSMLACKREAEFLEKYFDAVREKLGQRYFSLVTLQFLLLVIKSRIDKGGKKFNEHCSYGRCSTSLAGTLCPARNRTEELEESGGATAR